MEVGTEPDTSHTLSHPCRAGGRSEQVGTLFREPPTFLTGPAGHDWSEKNAPPPARPL